MRSVQLYPDRDPPCIHVYEGWREHVFTLHSSSFPIFFGGVSFRGKDVNALSTAYFFWPSRGQQNEPTNQLSILAIDIQNPPNTWWVYIWSPDQALSGNVWGFKYLLTRYLDV